MVNKENAHMDITKLTQEQLCEAYSIMNSWGWYDDLGEKPPGFDNMIRYRRTIFEKLFRVPAREDYISPLMRAIERVVPEKELLRYHHIHNLGRTNEEFETFWFLDSGGCFTGSREAFQYFSKYLGR